MIATEQKFITVHPDNEGEELCLRIEDSDSYTGILNLCWLTVSEAERLIRELTRVKEELKEKQNRMDEIIRTTDFNGLYAQFERLFNPYPVQMSRAEAFGKALAAGLIDEDTYQAAYRRYRKLWFYVGD